MFPSMIYIAASLEEVMLCITFELPLLRRLHWPGCTELRSPKNLATSRLFCLASLRASSVDVLASRRGQKVTQSFYGRCRSGNFCHIETTHVLSSTIK